jgi:hypothetical protein
LPARQAGPADRPPLEMRSISPIATFSSARLWKTRRRKPPISQRSITPPARPWPCRARGSENQKCLGGAGCGSAGTGRQLTGEDGSVALG